MATSFHRGVVVCDIALSPDGWDWLVFVAVDRDHPFHGRHFLVLDSGHSLTHVSHSTGVSSHDARWWFMVDTQGVVDDLAALKKIFIVSDELTDLLQKQPQA